MNRSHWIALVVYASTGGAIVACAEHVTLGTNVTTEKLTSVDPSAVGGVSGGITFGPCDPGMEHPNVCCTTDGGTGASCGIYPDDPFEPCPDGSTTYPDPRSCCDLNDGGCAPNPNGPALEAGVCAYQCPPGFTSLPQSAPNSYGCCLTENECFEWSFNIVREGPDGGAITGVNPQSCTDCPPGWESVSQSEGVCCGTIDGQPACYSVAVGAAAAVLAATSGSATLSGPATSASASPDSGP